MKQEKYFTYAEAIERLIDMLDGYTGYYSDLHHYTFNEDYYLYMYSEARKALNEYDVFDAIEKIVEYERDNFGELYTDLSDPAKVANMLFYIIGMETLYDYDERITDYYNEILDLVGDDDINKEFTKILETVLNEKE